MALTNLQYESIIRKYEQTRDANRRLEAARREEVYRRVPGYRVLADSVSTVSVSMAKKMLETDVSSKEELHEALQKIAKQKKELLTDAGYPASYLEPIYNCPACQDTGYVQNEEGGKKKCSCFRLQEITLLYEQSNIQDIVAKENFSTLSYDFYKGEDLQRFRSAVNLSQSFVQNFKQDYQNLFFYGTVGTGKSFLSGCIANELLKQAHSVIYFSAVELFDTLARYSFDVKAKESLYNFVQDLYNCDLIIIDDLGTEMTTSFVTSQLFSCLNERHLRRKATIISTNLSLEELRDRYSDRVFSRITSNYSLCKLTGPDIRLYKKRAANASNL